jgi:hypothetical protein
MSAFSSLRSGLLSMTSHSVASGCGGSVTTGTVVVVAGVVVVVVSATVVVGATVVGGAVVVGAVVVVLSTGRVVVISHSTVSPARNW